MTLPRLPRNHSYIHFRNDGLTIHLDFPSKVVPALSALLESDLFKSVITPARAGVQVPLRPPKKSKGNSQK